MIYAVIVVMWAAFLVPMWLRRHDEFAEAKSVDKFASKMRVLARRTGEAEADARASAAPARPASVRSGTISSTVRIVGREHPASAQEDLRPTAIPPSLRPTAPATKRRRAIRDAWADDADDAALAALAAPDLARDLARDRGFGRAPASLTARRRRVLAVLAGATLLLAILAVVGVVSWLITALGAGVTIAYVLHLRVQAKRTREIARRRTRAARPGLASAASPAKARNVRTGVRTRDRATELDRLDLLEGDGEDDDGWQPVSVPVPTYVTAPRAGRAIRRIDLHGDDAWTSGRLVADAAAAGRAAAAAAHQESLLARDLEDDDTASIQRAVGD